MKVVGLVNSSGDYQGRRYHNLVIHVTYQETNGNKDVKGVLTDTVKVRYVDLDTIFGMGLADSSDAEKLGTDYFSFLLGSEIEVAYNKFGAVQAINVIEEAPKEKKETNTAVHADTKK